ncbi:MAG: PocR ligand-binding domain-containing protein [Anaerolineae bacterium]|nr:PocR ligand-binding domain-containing protein [Anaerolineae bacterium]
MTTKQVQELLQVDRTTIYRMINDGRLTGVKVGQQWRFARTEIQTILEGESTSGKANQPDVTPEILPTHCVQVIQDVFAEVAEVGAITTHLNGDPITQSSNCTLFCQLIRATDSGNLACKASWQKLAATPEINADKFFTCHAGLQYSRAGIRVSEHISSILVAGQYYTQAPDPDEEAQRIHTLARKHGISPDALLEASAALPVLDPRLQQKIGRWLLRVAQTFGDIGRERAELMGRLQKIAEMSKFDLMA